MSIGIVLSPEIAHKVMEFCDKKGIEYIVWNKCEIIKNTGSDIDFELDFEDDAYNQAEEIIEKVKLESQNKGHNHD